MNFIPPKSLEEQNFVAQLDLWQQRTKYETRKIALETASKIKVDSADELLRAAEKIYAWLTKDIEEKNAPSTGDVHVVPLR